MAHSLHSSHFLLFHYSNLSAARIVFLAPKQLAHVSLHLKPFFFVCVSVMARRALRIAFYYLYARSSDDLSTIDSFTSIIVKCVRFNIFVV